MSFYNSDAQAVRGQRKNNSLRAMIKSIAPQMSHNVHDQYFKIFFNDESSLPKINSRKPIEELIWRLQNHGCPIDSPRLIVEMSFSSFWLAISFILFWSNFSLGFVHKTYLHFRKSLKTICKFPRHYIVISQKLFYSFCNFWLYTINIYC